MSSVEKLSDRAALAIQEFTDQVLAFEQAGAHKVIGLTLTLNAGEVVRVAEVRESPFPKRKAGGEPS